MDRVEFLRSMARMDWEWVSSVRRVLSSVSRRRVAVLLDEVDVEVDDVMMAEEDGCGSPSLCRRGRLR